MPKDHEEEAYVKCVKALNIFNFNSSHSRAYLILLYSPIFLVVRVYDKIFKKNKMIPVWILSII